VDRKHPYWKEWNVPGEAPTWAATDQGGRFFFREDVRRIEALEEFLHDVQMRRGLMDGKTGIYPNYEIHVKDFMIRHRSLLGISDSDAEIVQQMLLEQLKSGVDVSGVPLVAPASARTPIRRP
jgi:hypothetical protein